MKHFLFLLFICLFYESFSQETNSRVYEYDSGGNRIVRKVIILQKNTQGENNILSDDDIRTAENSYYLYERVEDLNISVYPNPTTSVIRLLVETEAIEQGCIAEIYTIDGRKMQQYKIVSFSTDIDLNSYSKGIYILKLRIGTQSREWKIIKK